MNRAWLTGVLFLCATGHCDSSESTLIEYRNATWWNGTTEYTGSRFVRDDRFVDPNGKTADNVIDLAGAVVTAPFAEGHNHNIVEPIFEVQNRQYLDSGVFYAKIPGIHPPGVTPIREALNRADTVDAIFGLGVITSPGGHPVPLYVDFLSEHIYGGGDYGIEYEDFSGQAFHEVTTEAEVASALDALVVKGTDFVKTAIIYSEEFDDGFKDGMDPDLLPFLVREAHARNLSVSLHVESAFDFRQGVAAGVDEVTHLPGMIWRPERSAAQHLLTATDAEQAAKSGVAVVPTTLFQIVMSERFSIPAERVAEFRTAQRHNLQLLIDAGVEIRIGSDVYDRTNTGEGGATPTRSEVENLVSLGVFDEPTVLARWIDTGRKIFPDRRIACFDAGCEASFLVFAADPRKDLANLDTLTLAIKQGVVVTEGRANAQTAN